MTARASRNVDLERGLPWLELKAKKGERGSVRGKASEEMTRMRPCQQRSRRSTSGWSCQRRRTWRIFSRSDTCCVTEHTVIRYQSAVEADHTSRVQKLPKRFIPVFNGVMFVLPKAGIRHALQGLHEKHAFEAYTNLVIFLVDERQDSLSEIIAGNGKRTSRRGSQRPPHPGCFSARCTDRGSS